MIEYDVIVIGGGMVGQSFALSLLQKSELKVAIIEPNNPQPKLKKDFHTRVSAINLKSEDLLTRLGVWELIKRKHVFTKTKVWDQNSHGSISFNSQDESLSSLGSIIENDAIQKALYESLSRTSAEYIKAKLSSIKKINNGYQIRLDNDENITCQLLIGADGALSRTRELAGIEFSTTNYNQQAIICNITTTNDFEDTTWQRFLSDSIVAVLPLSNTQASIVWSANNHLAEDLISLSTEDFVKRLENATEHRFGRLKVASDIYSFPLIERSAKDYVKENLALVGDAAHNIHPLAGQGVNLGFADVEELTHQIINSNKPLGDYSVLRKYARSRRFDNELMAKTMTALNWIYKENNETLRWLRGLGMNIIDNNSSIKSFFQRQALGDTDKTPT